MISRLQSILFFLVVGITLSSSYVGKSRLMFEYDWPVPKKNLRRFPHPKSCFHFYHIKHDGSHVVKKCDGEEMFDYQSLQCKDRAFAKCWKDAVQRITSKKPKKDFSCPFPWGLYPDIEDCYHFYECLSETPYLRICPESMAFDKADRTCVPVKEAMCADETDVVEPGYRCPYKWGYFAHSKDCSKYYECLRKVPSIKTCKRNMLFDNLERKCIPMENVKCGIRFNPYERDASTAENFLSSSPKARIDGVTTKMPTVETVDYNMKSVNTERETTEHPKTGHSRFTTEHPGTGHRKFTREHPGTGYSRFTTERPGTGYSIFSTGDPGTGYSRFTTERPGTEYSRFTTERPGTGYSRFTTERPGTGYSRFTTERPGTGYSRFTTERPGTGYSRFTTERPGTGYSRFTTEGRGTSYTRYITDHPRTEYSRVSSEQPSTGYNGVTTELRKIEYKESSRTGFGRVTAENEELRKTDVVTNGYTIMDTTQS